MNKDSWIALIIASIITLIAATPLYYSRDYAHGPSGKLSEGSRTKAIEPMKRTEGNTFTALDSEAKGNLHNIFLACKAYWADQGPADSNSLANCSMDIIKNPTYGYVQSSDVVIAMESNNEENFSAYAFHKTTKKVWALDAFGNVE